MPSPPTCQRPHRWRRPWTKSVQPHPREVGVSELTAANVVETVVQRHRDPAGGDEPASSPDQWHDERVSDADVRVSTPAEQFAAVARELAETAGVAPTLEQLVRHAVLLVPCDWAAALAAQHITAKPARFSASSDPQLLSVVAEIAASAGVSPGWVAFQERRVVLCADLAAEHRFGAYATEMVRRTPIRSVLSFSLLLQDEALGVLTLYSRSPHAFDERAVAQGSVLADHAAIAVEASLTARRAESLEEALESNRTIGMATGILVERHKLTPQQAFALLRTVSQHSNRKVLDVAEALVTTGEIPSYGRKPRPETS
jgi:GAF domain-containing protein